MKYTVNGFVDKNRDAQQDVFFDTLAKSKSKFVVHLCEYRDLLSKVAQLGKWIVLAEYTQYSAEI